MLSAVAARKAALAARAQESPTNEPLPSASGSRPPIQSQPTKNGTPKRKSSSQKSRPDAKKPKKGRSGGKANEVLMDAFRQQADLIVVDDLEYSDSDSAMSVLKEYGDDLLPQSTKAPTTKRAWSPSKPVEDSSDEDIGGEGYVVVSSLFPHSRPRVEDRQEDAISSTFEPIAEQNVFVLNEAELNSLDFTENTTLIALNAQDTLCLLGTCTLAVLHGSIDLYGSRISASSKRHSIYAPRSSPLPILQATDQSGTILHDANLSPRLRALLSFKAVIALQESRTDVEGLSRVCRTFEGVFEPPRWQKSSMQAPFGISGLYMVTQRTKDLHAFAIPSSWSNALRDISSSENSLVTGIYFVKGPKNSGKSTFARTLVNRLLGTYQRVAFLECDLGQSEFTPGGMVSLNIITDPILGPPFTHPTLPNYAHFIGSTTPRSSPSHYLDAILALIQTYRLDIQTPLLPTIDDEDVRIQDTIPLVVNTMGWLKGLGADLTSKIENSLEATHVFNIEASTREEYPSSVLPVPIATPYQQGNYGAYYSHNSMESTTARLYTLEAITPFSTTAGYTAADLRSLSILSYFHACFPLDIIPGEFEQITARSWDTSRPLCAIAPYEIDCQVALDKVILTGPGSEDVVEEEVRRVLNGAIVGLVTCEPGTLDLDTTAQSGDVASASASSIPYTQTYAPPSPASSRCFGLALIRAVSPPVTAAGSSSGQDSPRTYLQMLCPLPHALLAKSRVLVKGEMELPIWGMLDFRNFNGGKNVDPGDVAGVEREKVPFLQWGKAPEGVIGAEKKRVRRNLMRRGQM